jgi:hypothetical protein
MFGQLAKLAASVENMSRAAKLCCFFSSMKVGAILCQTTHSVVEQPCAVGDNAGQ